MADAARHHLRAVFPKSFASEFPHDNPELSEGVSWLNTSLLGSAQPRSEGMLMRPAPPSEPLKPRPLVRVKALRSPTLSPVPETPFERFVSAMVEVALGLSATHVAAELPGILRDGRLRGSALGAEAEQALRLRGYLLAEGSAASDAFVATQGAWRDVLSGRSENFAACGASTLDDWAAALLSALLGRPATRADELKRALRGRGVAAFGMREAA